MMRSAATGRTIRLGPPLRRPRRRPRSQGLPSEPQWARPQAPRLAQPGTRRARAPRSGRVLVYLRERPRAARTARTPARTCSSVTTTPTCNVCMPGETRSRSPEVPSGPTPRSRLLGTWRPRDPLAKSRRLRRVRRRLLRRGRCRLLRRAHPRLPRRTRVSRGAPPVSIGLFARLRSLPEGSWRRLAERALRRHRTEQPGSLDLPAASTSTPVVLHSERRTPIASL